MKISVVVLTQNNEKTIRRCLSSARVFADEILVIDSFSTDGTLEICKPFRAKILQKKFSNVGNSRNFGFRKAKNNWVFFIDSDEEVSAALSRSLKALSQPNGAAAFSVFIKPKYLGAWMRSPALSQWQPRLLRKGSALFDEMRVHSWPEIKGGLNKLDGALLHYSIATVSEQFRKIDSYAAKEAEQKKLLGESDSVFLFPFVALFDSVFIFLKRIFFELAFLDGWRGIFFAIASSYYFALADYKFFFKKY